MDVFKLFTSQCVFLYLALKSKLVFDTMQISVPGVYLVRIPRPAGHFIDLHGDAILSMLSKAYQPTEALG